MSNIVVGKNVIVFKFDASLSAWVPYACARSCTFTLETSSLETSITDAGTFRTYIPQSHTFTADMEGLTQLKKANHLSIADLMKLQIDMEIMLMRFQDESNNGDVFIKEAMFFIKQSTQTSSFDNVATFSVSLQGTGALTLVYTPTPIINPVMYREQFVLPAGETSVTVPAVNGVAIDDVIGIGLEFSGYPDIIGSGTPIGQEVLYQPSGATLTFPYPDFDTDRKGFIQYQIIYEGS